MLGSIHKPIDLAVYLGYLTLADNFDFIFFIWQLDLRDQFDIVQCGRHDFAAHRQHAAGLGNSFLEAAGNVRQRADEQVAQGMAVNARPFAEPVLKDMRDHFLVVGQCRQAVADVSGRQNAQISAQLAGGAAVVRHRHDSREVMRIFLHSAQQAGKPRAAADGDDLGSFGFLAVIGNRIGQRLAGFHERAQHRAVELHNTDQKNHQTGSAENDKTQPARKR